MTRDNRRELARQALLGFFKWVLPATLVTTLILLPSWTPRQLLWNSSVADWSFRIFITLMFASWHRTHAKVFTHAEGVDDLRGRPQPLKKVALLNWVVATLILISQLLVGIFFTAYFTWFAITKFTPILEPWWVVITSVHVSLVILPWLFYRKLYWVDEQTRRSLSK